MHFQGTRGAQRSADSEALVPAITPASKPQNASGDVLTAATVTAALPTDTAEAAAGASPTVQLTQVEWQAVLARLTALEHLPAQLATAHAQLGTLQTQMTAAKASFAQQLKEQSKSVMTAILNREQDPSIDDLPDDALKQIFQRLSTDDRRAISSTSHKWRRLVAESWTVVEVRLGGSNYLDSASKQIKWLLSLQLEHIACLRLDLKGVELSGTGVDYLLGPLLDLLEQGAFPELTTLYLAADMSLPGSLSHTGLQDLHLDMYALTATIQCPQLHTLFVRTVSMPGPTLFSKEVLAVYQKLKQLHLSFEASYVDEPHASWFMLDGLSLLTSLQHVVLDFPQGTDIHLSKVPVFPEDLTFLQLRCGRMDGDHAGLDAVYRLMADGDNLCDICYVIKGIGR